MKEVTMIWFKDDFLLGIWENHDEAIQNMWNMLGKQEPTDEELKGFSAYRVRINEPTAMGKGFLERPLLSRRIE